MALSRCSVLGARVLPSPTASPPQDVCSAPHLLEPRLAAWSEAGPWGGHC